MDEQQPIVKQVEAPEPPPIPDSWRYYGTWCGYCEYCSEYFTLTLTPRDAHARCPYCFTHNDRNKFWPQHLGI